MSELVTDWCHDNSVIPTQPIYTSVLDMPADNKETQRKRRLVCSLVGVIYNEEDDANQEAAEAQEEAEDQSRVVETVVEQLVHEGYNVQVGVRPGGEVPPSQ